MKKVIHLISLSFSFQDTIPSDNGYVMLDREFTNWPLFYDDASWKLFTYLLKRVNYTTRLWETNQVRKGKLVTSYQHLGDALPFWPTSPRWKRSETVYDGKRIDCGCGTLLWPLLSHRLVWSKGWLFCTCGVASRSVLLAKQKKSGCSSPHFLHNIIQKKQRAE